MLTPKPKPKSTTSEITQVFRFLFLNYAFIYIMIKATEVITNQTFDEVYISNKLLFFFCVFLSALFVIFSFKITDTET